MRIVVLGSGSKGNSTLVQINNKIILIDVGFSYIEIKRRLETINVEPNQINYLLLTHEHNDHIFGLKTFLKRVKPELYIDKKMVNILFNEESYEKINILKEKNEIEGIAISVIPTSHDSKVANGFLIETDKESVVYITDTGYIHKKYLDVLKNKNYYIIESNHDPEMLLNGPYPKYLQDRIISDKGHLSNEFCGKYLSMLIGSNTKKVVLAHLSETNNNPIVALDTVKRTLIDNNITFTNIECAKQNTITECCK